MDIDRKGQREEAREGFHGSICSGSSHLDWASLRSPFSEEVLFYNHESSLVNIRRGVLLVPSSWGRGGRGASF